MRIALAQMEVVPGKPSKNLEVMLSMVERAKKYGAHLVAFPEMCVSGYLLGDKWRDEVFCKNMMDFNDEIIEASDGIAIAYGNIFLDSEICARVGENKIHPNKDGTARKYNAVYIVQNKQYVKRVKETLLLPRGVHVKTLHPNYRIFDDARYFFSLQDIAKDFGVKIEDLEQPFLIKVNDEEVPVGFEVCEDLWCEDYRLKTEALNPTQMLIKNGAQYVVNISASPWTWGKNSARDRKIKFLKQESGKDFVPFIYVNCVGVQNNGKNIVTFDGGSTVYNDNAEPILLSRSAYKEELLLIDDFSKPIVQRTEKPKIAQKLEAIIKGIHHLKDICGVNVNPPFVIGISGGIDSAVSAALLSLAVGPDKVLGVNMPTNFNSQKTRDTARLVAENLGIKYIVIPILEPSIQIKKILESLPLPNGEKLLTPLQFGNVMAKIRGTDVLSNVASKLGALFTNNGNKLEVALGYATLYGDVNGAIAPIADLTKTDVVDMARYLNEQIYMREVIPSILLPDKLFRFSEEQIQPSAELEENQVDPMKFGYHCALLEAFTDFRRKAPEEIMQWYLAGKLEEKLHVSTELIKRWNMDDPKEFIKDLEWFYKTIDENIFKRVQGPPIIILTKSAYGYDIRESMMPYESKERAHAKLYRELKQRVLALPRYTS